MEDIELKLKTNDGEVNLKFTEKGDELTWTKLARYFTYALKGLGYFPKRLEEFLDDEEESYEVRFGDR